MGLIDLGLVFSIWGEMDAWLASGVDVGDFFR